ncbi:2'-5' RNA ligase family protein [Indiicoccus explosivorum]|uniref:2'-5' RNA ligase family protein n=1 Tax=Indiicoccus explosivorum TaxID=1917864 RepID=UPI00138FF5DA|nr:2'-5' RNA ligase family protein [Indiicoccus explosivorum]
MQVLVLRLDYKSSAVIERLQQQAALTAHSERLKAPPHLSLQAFRQADPAALKPAVQNSIGQLKEFGLVFGSLGFFKQSGTIFASPGVSKPLTDLHLSLHLGTREFGGQNELYLPDNWVPHATISTNIAPPIWGPLFARLAMEFEPFSAKVAAVECWTVAGGRISTDWSLFLN